jgi:hypothetical protein
MLSDSALGQDLRRGPLCGVWKQFGAEVAEAAKPLANTLEISASLVTFVYTCTSIFQYVPNLSKDRPRRTRRTIS